MQNRSWASINLKDGQTALEAIEQWFYTETPAGIVRGDVAVDDNFRENAMCVLMDHGSGEARMDTTNVRPSVHRYFVFYSQAFAPAGPLHIWGGLTVDHLLPILYQSGGVVHRDRDLVWQPEERTRCRSVLRRPPILSSSQFDTSLLWLFPLLGSQFQDASHNNHALTGEVFNVLLARLEFFASPRGSFPAGSCLEEHLLDKASYLLAANLTRELYPQEAALAYEQKRKERERLLYWERWAPFLEAGELPLLQLLQHNAGLWQWLMARMVAPTPEDEQAWCYTGHNPETIPTIWFALPCVQITLSHFPIHAGGLVHVPAYAHWIAAWIWDGLVVPEAQRHFAQAPIPKQSSMLHRVGVLEEAKSWALRAQVPRTHASTTTTNVGMSTPPLDEGGGIDIEDLGDMWHVLPPCIRRIRQQKRFFLDGERRFIVQVMRLGGLSLESILEFFEELNNRYPKLPKPVTLQRRFNVEESLKGWKKRPDNGQQIWCTSLVNNALDKGGGPGHLVCPYALDAPSPPDRAVFTGRCRERCVAESGCAGPKRKDHWKPWAAPAMALKEALEKGDVDQIL